METDRLTILQNDDYYVPNFGSTGRKGTTVVPMKVRRAYAFNFDYDLVNQGALSAELASETLQDNVLLGLSDAVTDINGVTNIFQVSPNKALVEMFQVFWGMSPPLVRAWIKMPNANFMGVGDQNMVPSTSFPNLGYLDGEDSPYNRPSQRSMFISVREIEPNWAFYSPYPWAVTPRMNFLFNRMAVSVVTDPAEVRKVLLHQVPQLRVTIGNPMQATTFPGEPYGSVQPIDPAAALLPEKQFEAVLESGGYLKLRDQQLKLAQEVLA